MKISIIIPTLNEASTIKRLVVHLYKHGGKGLHEIIVSDGGSADNTVQEAENAGAKIVKTEIRGRAFQMNAGAKIATGDVLYFVHADAIPPAEFMSEIQNAVFQKKKAGCFRFRFDTDRKLLAVNAYFTRFNGIFSGGGDQSLYIERKLFDELGGFNEANVIMEDFELVNRLRKRKHKLHIIQKEITVSARKYTNNSYLRVNLSSLLVFLLYKMRVKPVQLSGLYKKLIRPYTDKNESALIKADMAVNAPKEIILSVHKTVDDLFPVEQEKDLYTVQNERYS